MPQYSNSFVLQDGGTVNAVFDTEINTITYTVTTPQGQTATLTLPPDENPQSVPNLNNIRQQIRNQGGSALTIVGFGQALQAVQFNTKEQESRAVATSTATNTPPPANPNPPPPVSNSDNPQVPAINTEPNVESTNTSVSPATNPSDENVTSSPQQPTNISLGTAPLNEFSTDRQLSTDITTPINDFATDVQTQNEIVANDDAGVTAGGGEDIPADQIPTNILGPAVDDENLLNPDDLENSADETQDPNLTALEAADDDEIQSNEDITNLSQIRSDIDDQDDLETVSANDNTTSEFDELEQFDYPEPVESTETTLGTTEGETDEGNLVNEQVESANPSSRSTNVSGATASTRNQADLQYGINFSALKDWRVKLKLAPGSNYFYNASAADRGILAPLNETKGVIFPYTPNIVVNYVANYDTSLPSHSNYKIVQYQSSAVDSVSITCDFTAQDTKEANYLLAVIHFLRSVTKMFYGQDQNPKRGTPPPLCYLEGLGNFQFDNHPLVVQSFNYSLPNDVDYIRAMPATGQAGANVNNSGQAAAGNSTDRLSGTGASVGGVSNGATFSTPATGQALEPTYVPTKMQIQINCMPVVSRKDISDTFSLKDYAKGTLLQGSKRAGGGIW